MQVAVLQVFVAVTTTFVKPVLNNDPLPFPLPEAVVAPLRTNDSETGAVPLVAVE